MSNEEQSVRKRRIGWVLAWALTVVLAFVLGFQTGDGRRVAAMNAEVSAPAAAQPTEPAPTAPTAPTAAATPNPEVAAMLQRLPRRQADDPLAKGDVDAKVVLTEWSDYRCPYCARWATQTLPELQRFVDDGTLRIEYRDMAVFGDPSVNVAVAARAAGQQGRFWEYYQTIFSAGEAGDNAEFTTDDLVAMAGEAGVPDLDRFRSALDDPALRQAVLADTQEAQEFGITGTPFFVIDTTVINGAQPTANFVSAIEQAASAP